jgi:hypothetical protein
MKSPGRNQRRGYGEPQYRRGFRPGRTVAAGLIDQPHPSQNASNTRSCSPQRGGYHEQAGTSSQGPAILNLHERIENKLFLDRTRKDSNFKRPYICATLFQIEKCWPGATHEATEFLR